MKQVDEFKTQVKQLQTKVENLELELNSYKQKTQEKPSTKEPKKDANPTQ